jgi:hypothetical protein
MPGAVESLPWWISGVDEVLEDVFPEGDQTIRRTRSVSHVRIVLNEDLEVQ